jgi:beta-xylosidase
MAPGGVAIIKSKTGKPQGPYVSALTQDEPLVGGIDPTLLQDDDGNVYFANGGGGSIHLMKDDLSGFAGAGRRITLEGPNVLGAGGVGRPPNRIGHEGVSLFKANGTYYLGAADNYQGRYSSMVAQSKTIYGPYTLLQEAVPCGGGTNYFRDKQGRWWCAFFGNDEQAPWREKPGIVPIEFEPDGQILVAKPQEIQNHKITQDPA